MGTLSQRKNILAYIEMYNNIDFLYQAIRDHAETKNHVIDDIIIAVDDETKKGGITTALLYNYSPPDFIGK